ncbi:hypothetical protein D6D02_06839 [Aureobasidium pullulans]|uniref:HPP transmembrane region domain-containing protein n=1 Tax=Aureobasidium pullulans TaxID=5580 RepID=A0A4T0CTJ9_AURPU|nr:hypothetical protein D6D26_09196 [Aureobasidium pullulans]THW15660.1 hypothetical protein D6D24_04840 [Aureobasidium pullulans]THX76905.1 hypothetical protein D6D04_06585 [Aureobasidium pullulans]THY07165.1 hypothetical protein D6D03_01832 [Aureobasidium pullulans]THY09199.1 hypothetical protein D6D02_06839 [Aureobasidium pullulans]
MHPRILSVLDYDIDNHLNRIVPHSRVSRLPKPVSRFLGYRENEYKEPTRLVVVFWSFLGSLLGLLIIGAMYKYAPGLTRWNPPIMIASLGASAILDYNSIRTPLAQPRNAILGQTFSALTGVIIHKLFHLNSNWEDVQWVAGAVACAISSAIMATTNTVHPPGGATAVLATTNAEIIAMGWIYIPFVLMSSCVMLALACILNNIQRAYPVYWWTPADLKKEKDIEDLEKVSSNGSEKVLRGQSMARTSQADPDTVVISPHHLYIPDTFDLDGDELAVLSRLQARLRWDSAMDERPRADSSEG